MLNTNQSTGIFIVCILIQIERNAEVNISFFKIFSSDDEEFSSPFFPTKTKSKKVDLSDTFSIREMIIESDESDNDSGDSHNLELLPPSIRIKFIDKVIYYFCCLSSNNS